MNTTLCNICMIEDAATGRVLVQHRVAKPTNPWCGLTFTGGHVESGESITASTVREIREETGLTVSNMRMCGVVALPSTWRSASAFCWKRTSLRLAASAVAEDKNVSDFKMVL